MDYLTRLTTASRRLLGRSAALASLWLTLASATAASEPAPQRLKLHMQSGRTWEAAIDARSDSQTLWLRFDSPRMQLSRPVAWEAVREVELDSQRYTSTELRSAVAILSAGLNRQPLRQDAEPSEQPVVTNLTTRLALPAAMIPAVHATRDEPGLSREPEILPAPPLAIAEPVAESAPRRPHSPTLPQDAPRVRSIQGCASLAHWGANTEADGLLVELFPLDAWGTPRAVRGTLQVELIGSARGPLQGFHGFPVLGRWTHQVEPHDFHASSAVYRCAFQSVHPEFATYVGTHGIVRLRLSVPGEGTFEMSTSATRLRSFNPLRDQLQQRDNVRFFPQERTGRPKQAIPQQTGR